MKIYLVDEKLESIDTSDITSVDIIGDKKHTNNFTVYVSDNFSRYRFYSVAYALGYSKKDCINQLKQNLIQDFYIPEDKIRVS